MTPIVSTYQFTVPHWEGVRLFDEYTTIEKVETPPDLGAEARAALNHLRLFYALVHHPGETNEDDQSMLHPYAIGGPSVTYYSYEAEDGYAPTLALPEQLRVKKRYGFFPVPPDSFDHHYEYDPDEAVFEILVSEKGGNYAIRMDTSDTESLYLLNAGTRSMHAIMMRATVIVHVLAGLKGDWSADSLPWDVDSVEIARQRILHALKWKFEDSPSRNPMKA